jgi:tetratricopeptide (TPR) repeat protein/CHAT domain-containing protein
LSDLTATKEPTMNFRCVWVAMVVLAVTAAGRAQSPPEKPPKPVELTEQQKKRLEERQQLLAQAQKEYAAGKVPATITALGRVADIEREVWGPTHDKVAATCTSLATLYEVAEDFAGARKARADAAAIWEKLYGRDDWRVREARFRLEDVDRSERREPEGRAQLRQAQEVHRQAEALLRQGKYREAVPLADKVLQAHRKWQGETHPDYATSVNNLAWLHDQLGEYSKALQLCEEARGIYKKTLGEDNPSAIATLSNLAHVYLGTGDYDKALRLYEQVRDRYRKSLGDNAPLYAVSLHNLAVVYHALGEYGKALPLSRQARDTYRQVRGENDSQHAFLLNHLATLYREMREYDKALPLYRQALDVRRRTVGEDHPQYAATLKDLGALYRETGEHARALPLLERAIDVYRKRLGTDHPEYAAAVANLALLYQVRLSPARAVPLFKEALDVLKRARLENRPEYTAALNGLGVMYRDMREYDKALPLLELACDIRRKLPGEDHPLYVQSLGSLAKVYQIVGEYGKAERLYEQLCDICKRTRGETHLSYALGLGDLGGLYKDTGDYQKVLPLLEQVSDIIKKYPGEHDHDVYLAKSFFDLADLHQKLGQYDKALPLWRQALELDKKTMGENHPYYANTLTYLAALHRDTGDYDKALKLFAQARAILEKARAEDHPYYADCLCQLAALHQKKQENREALPLFERALEIYKRAFGGENRPEYINALSGLALLYRDAEAYDEALPLLKQARDLSKKVFGENHPHYADSLDNLAAQYQKQKEYDSALSLFEQARDIRKKALGVTHPRYAASLDNLARLSRATGDDAKAARFAREAREARAAADAEALKAEAAAERRKRLEERDRLLAQARKEEDAGDMAACVAALARAADIGRQVLGPAHEKVGDTLDRLAWFYEVTEDFAAARKARAEAVAIWSKVYGKDDWRVVSARFRLQDIDVLERLDREARAELRKARELTVQQVQPLYRQGRTREALKVAEQVRRIHQRLLGQKHLDYALGLGNLALLYSEVGEHRLALPLALEATATIKAVLGENHPEYAAGLNTLGNLYQDMGDYRKALPLRQQAVDIARQTMGEKEFDYAVALENLGRLYTSMGDPARALPLLERACDIHKKVLGPREALYAHGLASLAEAYQQTGDTARALELLEQARDIYKAARGDDHPDYAATLGDLAELYQQTGEYGRALPLLEQAPRDVRTLTTLAAVYRGMGDTRRAVEMLKRARAVSGAAAGETTPAYAGILNDLGVLYHETGDSERALLLLGEARDIAAQTLGETHPSYAAILGHLGLATRHTGDDAGAARVLHKGLRAFAAASDTIFSAQPFRLRLEHLSNYRIFLDMYLSTASAAGTDPAEIHGRVLAWKGALVARQAEERLALEQPELAPLITQLRQARAALAQVSQDAPTDPRLQPDWVKRLRKREIAKEDLEGQLALKSAAFRRARKLSSTDVAADLPPDAAFVDLLEYTHSTPAKAAKGRFTAEQRFLAFVLRKGREPVMVELGKAQQVEEAVTAWRKSGLTSAAPDADARKLGELVWQPIRKHLGEVKTVYLSPDGALAKFPFAALPGSKPDSFLLEEMTFVHVTSGRHLLELADERHDPKSSGLLAVGALDFGKPAAGQNGWQPLPGAEAETRSIRDAFSKRFPAQREPRVLSGPGIDSTRLQRELLLPEGPRWRFLHLATHGFFQEPKSTAANPPPKLPEDPLTLEEVRRLYAYDRNPLLSSGLVLSGANADRDKGVLTAEEVMALDLRGTELAVLSACETGLGKVSGSQGVEGLQQAFHAAGARSLVASLWHVDDAATSVLMEEFYANLWQKRLSRADALRQAQLTVLKDPGRVRARARELRAALVERGVPEEVLAARGLGKAVDLPDGGKVEKGQQRRSPPKWWAAFLLSGDSAKLD